MLSAALQYAHRGWRVFPLAPRSKTPRRGSHGYLDGTTDPETIERWWEENPEYNVAIVTGPAGARTSCPQGLVVFDIDLRNGGDASLYDLERHWGELPDTLTVNTSGGWHLYFAHPGGTLPAGFGDDFPGLDLKANGGYVVAPPSIHPDGSQYTWKLGPEDVPLAELPKVWAKLLQTRARLPAPATPDEPAELKAGQRHTSLVSLAGRLLNAGLGTPEQIRAALHATNRERCDPPLPDSEVDAIASASGAWEQRRSLSPREEACPDCVEAARYLPPRPRGGWGGSPRGSLVTGEAARATTGEPPKRRPLTGLDVKAMVRATTWMWPGWIAEGHVTVLAGESGAGKSWLAVALAKCAAHGLPWPDGAPGPEGERPVLWLESEGRHAVLLERAERLGLDPQLLYFMPRPLQTYYLDRTDDFDQIFEIAEVSQPRLIVVDSWSKSLAGKENDADVRFCLDSLQGLARFVHAPVLLVHHLRKRQLTDYSESFDFDRLRGSSVLAQVAACIMGVDQPNRGAGRTGDLACHRGDLACRRASCGKANLGPLPEPFGFTITDAGLTFGPPPEEHAQTSRLDDAKAFLRRALADGPKPANAVKDEAKEEGISDVTLRRAKQGLCQCIRQGGGHNRWLWALAAEEEGENVEQDGHLEQVIA
jgi:hypothetical protein